MSSSARFWLGDNYASTRRVYQVAEIGHGEEMPLDQLDQQMVDSLPQLADVYDRYGVQVNALSVTEIFALYERTGFLYPDKAARLFPHVAQVRENWRRMLRVGDSLLYVLTAGDQKRGLASLAVWRASQNGWMSQHLVSDNNPYASRAVLLAAAAVRSAEETSATSDSGSVGSSSRSQRFSR